MMFSKFGKGKTIDCVERRRKLEDEEIGRLLDTLCFTDKALTSDEKVQLYNTFVREIKKNRLRRFIDLNYVLLIVGLLLACSCMVVLVTGYDGNMVLFYLSCATNLCLCMYVVSQSFRGLRYWLLIGFSEEKENE